MKRLGLFLLTGLVAFGFSPQQKPDVSEADGIRTIRNPNKPAKGTIVLEVEKLREINPFDNAEVDLKWLSSVRMEDGRVILFDVNRSKAYLFSPNGQLLKDLVRNGQGPGEFPAQNVLFVHPLKGRIYITGGRKLGKFDDQGVFLEDLRIDDMTMTFIDETSYVTIARGSRNADFQTPKKAVIKKIQSGGAVVEGPVLKEGLYLQSIRNPENNGGFSDDLCIPSLEYAYDPFLKRVYVVEKAGCSIEAYDLSGKKLFVSSAPFGPYHISRKEVEVMYEPMVKSSPQSKWIIDAYPDKLMTTGKLTALPNGYLAVHRIVGPRKYEIEIFDKDGVWQYILKFPEGMIPYNENFYGFGFSNIEAKDDMYVYVEYKVKNFPEIFGK